MKAIFINAFAQSVTEINYSGNFKDISHLLGCRMFDCVRYDATNAIYVDDEGLFVENNAFFKYSGNANPLAGNGLILNSDEEGETIDTNLTAVEVAKKITWLPMGLYRM